MEKNELEVEIVRLKSLLKSKDLDLKSAEEVRQRHAKQIAYLQSQLRKAGGKIKEYKKLIHKFQNLHYEHRPIKDFVESEDR